jgi:hypothetical protein
MFHPLVRRENEGRMYPPFTFFKAGEEAESRDTPHTKKLLRPYDRERRTSTLLVYGLQAIVLFIKNGKVLVSLIQHTLQAHGKGASFTCESA